MSPCLSIYCKWCHHRTIYALSRFSLTNFPIHVTFFICVLLTKVNRRQNMRKVQPRVSSPFQISQILNRNKNVDNALERNLKLSEHYLVKDDCVRLISFSRNLLAYHYLSGNKLSQTKCHKQSDTSFQLNFNALSDGVLRFAPSVLPLKTIYL